ncbi:hypothetical protein [Glaciecola sp. 1036]|uniref:hypothetical protein n=1 Tax=Alteromonadaceae TaxID=72275 RepID=UPI003D03F688
MTTLSTLHFVFACSDSQTVETHVLDPKAPISEIRLEGVWVVEQDGTTMLNPQSSGLSADENYIYSLSDASADESQVRRLHLFNPESAEVIKKIPITDYQDIVVNSCFYTYLNGMPDFEAMVRHPLLQNHWIWVTEDATRGEPLTPECAQQYANSGSTDYPSLLVLLKQHDDHLSVESVRPVQFDVNDNMGNFPNDGIEGLAVTKDARLLLGVEKDANTQPRVFEVQLTAETFSTTDFLPVKDAELDIPTFDAGNHPINGMDTYYASDEQGYLIAAARNDNELWIIDLNKKKPTVILPLVFYAPSLGEGCEPMHLMDNASLEGVAVHGDTLYLINDPWKRNYHKNATCEGNLALYQRFSPLLFKLKIQNEWF